MFVPIARPRLDDINVHRLAFVALAACWTGAVSPADVKPSPKLVIRVTTGDETADCPVAGPRSPHLFQVLANYALDHLVREVDHVGLDSDSPIEIRYLPLDGSTQSPPGLSISIDPRTEVGRIHVESSWQNGAAWIDACVHVGHHELVIDEMPLRRVE